MSNSGIHLNLSAGSPEEMRELFEKCMAETDKLHYDGKLIRNPGAGQVYVFGEDCPDCKARQWLNCQDCTVCKGRKEIGPAWTMKDSKLADG